MAASDGQLVEKTRQGDREAFGRLVDRYRDMAYGLAYHLTRDFEAARDLVQDAFVQAYLHLGQLREPEKFAGWLRRITTNVHRMNRRRREVPTVALEQEANMVREEPRASEVEVVVQEALARLTAPDRLALTLHYVNGYSSAEIGRFLGIRSETVRARLTRARQNLREELLQMAEDVFRENALAPEFREDVIGAVNRLVEGLRSRLPDGLGEIRQRLRRQRNERWRHLAANLPAPWGPPFKERPEAPRIAVARLPDDLRQELRESLYYWWLDLALQDISEDLPWIADFDSLWIRYFRSRGRLCVWLANVPGGSGTIFSVGLEPKDVADLPAETEPAQAEEALAALAMPTELREAFGRLREALPASVGSLSQAMHGEMARLLRQVWDDLPVDAKAGMGAELSEGLDPARWEDRLKRGERMSKLRSVAAKSLSEPTRERLKKAVILHWGRRLLATVAHLPSWLTDFDRGEVEFGVRERDADLKPWGGQPYIKIYGPDGERDAFETNIPRSSDD